MIDLVPISTQDDYILNETGTNLIFTRQSAYYHLHRDLWLKAIAAYNGGRKYLVDTLKQHPSETAMEYADRVANAYNINLIKYSTNRFGDYIFSKPPRRTNINKELEKDFDRQKKSVNSTMRELFDYFTICNLVWILVDAPEVEGDQIDLRTKSDMKYRPYCKIYAPIDVPDWSFDSVGELNWIIFEEMIVEKDDPSVASVVKKRRTLYTKAYWQTFDAILDDGGKTYANGNLIISARHPNKINRVPVIPYTNIMFQPYFNHPPIDDILTINDAVLAGESELLTNILKQTYGQLVLPSSAEKLVNRIRMKLMKADPDLDMNSDAVRQVIAQEVNIELSRTKAIMEDAEERNIARYIQPSGANITNIIDHDDRLTSLMMKLYGFLVGVHTTQKESAESKSVDNISLAAQLSAIAARLEELENNIWQMFKEYDSSITIPKIEYNRDYDINELKSVIAAIVELVNINAGESYKKEVKLACVDILDRIHTIPAENYEQIKREIDGGKEASIPLTFEAQATHASEASGSTPDSITARTDYQKGSASIKKTESI